MKYSSGNETDEIGWVRILVSKKNWKVGKMDGTIFFPFLTNTKQDVQLQDP